MAPRARRMKGRGRANRGAGNHQAENNQFAHQQHSVAGDQRLRASYHGGPRTTRTPAILNEP
jgi:hypothetical protein